MIRPLLLAAGNLDPKYDYDGNGLDDILVENISKGIISAVSWMLKWLWENILINVWEWIVVYSFYLCMFVSLICVIFYIVTKAKKSKNTAILSGLTYLIIQLLNSL